MPIVSCVHDVANCALSGLPVLYIKWNGNSIHVDTAYRKHTGSMHYIADTLHSGSIKPTVGSIYEVILKVPKYFVGSI